MRCRTCGGPAAINMRHHKLALCATHFPPWLVKQTERAIHNYRMFEPQDRILVAVSGGKDSLALWDILLKLGYQADGIYVDLGIDGGFGYSDLSKGKAVAFQQAHSPASLHIVDIAGTYGESVTDAAKRRGRSREPCSVCGVVKRHEMNRVALAHDYNVLATGHNLDDEAATLFGNVLHWQTSYLVKQGPVLSATVGKLARKVKPFCRIYERETAAYALLTELDYIYDECPYSKGAKSLRHKATLNRMEHDAPGTKLQFYAKFLQAKEKGFLPNDSEPATDMTTCERCGQPTMADGLCRFCRLWT